MDTEAGAESEFYPVEFETDHKDNLESKVTRNKSLLPGFCPAEQHVSVLPSPRPAEHHVPKDTTSIIEFHIMHSSPLADPASSTVD